jgi:putative nucleotidyltransferase with HDIG domain/PAS domain S-box-containing protein
MAIAENSKISGKVSAESIKDWYILIESMHQPAVLHDTDSNILLANKAFLDLYGKTHINGVKCHQLIHFQDSPDACPALEGGNSESREIYEPSLDKYFIIMSSPVTHEGNKIGFFHAITDITELKKSELHARQTIDTHTKSVDEMKNREQSHIKGREAFLNMLDDVSESYRELEELFLSLVKAMVRTLDAKSPWTKGHSERVAYYAEMIAKKMGFDEDDLKTLRLAGLLHDIGKIGTYDYLLDKPSRLTDEEFAIVKRHPVQGALIIQEIKQLHELVPIIRHHHERLDGRGYPDGLKGEDIPLFARILHVADSFDSMTSDRPYRPAPGVQFAISELQKFSNVQFDDQVVKIFQPIIENKEIEKLSKSVL